MRLAPRRSKSESLSFSFRTPFVLQLLLLPCCDRVACICGRVLYFLGFRSRLNQVGVSASAHFAICSLRMSTSMSIAKTHVLESSQTSDEMS